MVQMMLSARQRTNGLLVVGSSPPWFGGGGDFSILGVKDILQPAYLVYWGEAVVIGEVALRT